VKLKMPLPSSRVSLFFFKEVFFLGSCASTHHQSPRTKIPFPYSSFLTFPFWDGTISLLVSGFGSPLGTYVSRTPAVFRESRRSPKELAAAADWDTPTQRWFIAVVIPYIAVQAGSPFSNVFLLLFACLSRR